MGGLKVVRTIIGFEKRFASLTEAMQEFPNILLPGADFTGIMSTPGGRAAFDYCIGESQGEWNASTLQSTWNMIRKTGDLWGVAKGKAMEKYPPLLVRAVAGQVIFLSKQGYGFGFWRPNGSTEGGFSAFIESWLKKVHTKLAFSSYAFSK